MTFTSGAHQHQYRLGGAIDVPTLAGKAAIDISEGTQLASSSACAARASRAFKGKATWCICTATSRWKPRSSSANISATAARAGRVPCRKSTHLVVKLGEPPEKISLVDANQFCI
jgi:hypothetical protein